MAEHGEISYRPQTIGGGYDNGCSAFALASLFSHRKDRCDDNIVADILNGQNISDLRHEVTDSRAELTDTIRQVQSDLKNKICDVEKSAVEARWDAKLSISEAKNELSHKLCEVGHTLRDVKCELENKIESSKNVILKQLFDDRLADKQDIIDQLRHRNHAHEQSIAFGNQLNDIKMALSSIMAQEQRQTSKTVQFGSGNVAVPTNSNTNNQVG